MWTKIILIVLLYVAANTEVFCHETELEIDSISSDECDADGEDPRSGCAAGYICRWDHSHCPGSVIYSNCDLLQKCVRDPDWTTTTTTTPTQYALLSNIEYNVDNENENGNKVTSSTPMAQVLYVLLAIFFALGLAPIILYIGYMKWKGTIKTIDDYMDDWQLPRLAAEKIDFVIAEGPNGVIYKSTLNKLCLKTNPILLTALDGLGYEKNAIIEVVVKKSPENPNREKQDELKEEGKTNVDFTQNNTTHYHENIVMFLGVCTTGMPYMIVLAYCNQGSLLDRLRKGRRYLRKELMGHDMSEVDLTSCEIPLTLGELLKLAIQLCYGLKHMHDNGFVHRDMACRNCLLHKDTSQPGGFLRAKITDLGLTRRLDDNQQHIYKKGGRLPVFWEAIESRCKGIYSPASDCWSMGIVLYEMFTYGVRPYKTTIYGDPYITDENICAELNTYLNAGHRLKVPIFIDEQLADIIRSCWHKSPYDRPDMTDLIIKLSEYEKSLPVSRQREYMNVFMGSPQLAGLEENSGSQDYLRDFDNANFDENNTSYVLSQPLS